MKHNNSEIPLFMHIVLISSKSQICPLPKGGDYTETWTLGSSNLCVHTVYYLTPSDFHPSHLQNT
jgi:hypothetical protein